MQHSTMNVVGARSGSNVDQERQKLVREKDAIIRKFEDEYLLNAGRKPKKNVKIKSYQDGSRYEGELINEKRNGKGIYRYANNDCFVGDWKDDRFHGRGYYIFLNGERYEGDLTEGLKQGKGSYFYSNGNSYVGDYQRDKKHGQGTYTYFTTNYV